MDCIRIKNLKIKARHGVYEFEKKKDGTFELDIALYLSLEKSGQSDKLEHTIDYDNIVSIATKAFTEKDYNLVEAAAESVCGELLNALNVYKITFRFEESSPRLMIKVNVPCFSLTVPTSHLKLLLVPYTTLLTVNKSFVPIVPAGGALFITSP